MSYLTKTGFIPDLFGGKKHIFTSEGYGAWIFEAKDGTCFVDIFDHDMGIMLTFQDNQRNTNSHISYNMAHIWLLIKIESMKNSK